MALATSDLETEYQIARGTAPAAHTSTPSNTGRDMQDTGPSFEAVMTLGAGSGTSPTLDITFDESDTATGTYTAISGGAATVFGQKTASHANTDVVKVITGRTKRFVKAIWTIGGTTPSFTGGMVLLAKKASY